MSDELPDDIAFGDGGFAKLYGDRLADSSLLECAVGSRWCFLYMLARADAQGRFRCASVAGLARAAAMSLDDAGQAIRELEAPDPNSTTPDEDGRRIIRIPGGWRIVTKVKYRDYQTARQRADAERKRRQREAAEQKRQQREADLARRESELLARERVGHVPGHPRDVPGTPAPEARGQMLENNNNNGTQPTAAIPASSFMGTDARKATTKRNATTGDVEAGAVRMVEVFNAVFGREAKATPDLIQTFGKRVAAGHRVADLVTLPLLAEAQELKGDVRKRIQPSWLLRDGTGHYAGNDGATRNTHPWLTATLEKADQTVIPAHLAPLAERFALTDALRQLKVKYKRVEAAETGPAFSAPRSLES